jgi:hypothetical protein
LLASAPQSPILSPGSHSQLRSLSSVRAQVVRGNFPLSRPPASRFLTLCASRHAPCSLCPLPCADGFPSPLAFPLIASLDMSNVDPSVLHEGTKCRASHMPPQGTEVIHAKCQSPKWLPRKRGLACPSCLGICKPASCYTLCTIHHAESSADPSVLCAGMILLASEDQENS